MREALRLFILELASEVRTGVANPKACVEKLEKAK